MSWRSNFVWIENDDVSIFGGRSSGDDASVAAQGADFCQELFFKLDKCDGFYAGNIANVLVDADRKHVLFYDALNLSIPCIRKYFLKRVEPAWQGWTVEWAFEGDDSIDWYLMNRIEGFCSISHMGGIKQVDLYNKPEPERLTEIENLNSHQDNVITIIKDGVISDYKTEMGIEKYLVLGTDMRNHLLKEQLIQHWMKEDTTAECALVDYDKQQIFACWGEPVREHYITSNLFQLWKWWNVNVQHDGLLFHFEHTGRDNKPIRMTKRDFKKYESLFHYSGTVP